VALQVHTSGDGPITPWGTTRKIFYDVGGIPDVWVDGITQLTGSYQNDTQDYNRMLNACNARWQHPTDVTIEVWGDQIDDDLWNFTVKVGLEANGQAKTVHVHLVQVLFDYPYSADGRYNNAVMYGKDMGTMDLEPNETVTLEHEFAFDATSWADKENTRVLAIVQDPASSGPAEVHQAEITFYPFAPPPDSCPWDFDDDGDIDTADLLFLLGAWGTPGGDVDEDGDTDTADLLELLAHWGDCPLPPCPWDFNGDRVVDEADQDILLEHWGDCPDPPAECPWDLNGDGVVNGIDLVELTEHFGPCPE
jgi:hypothetical protein